MKQGPVITADQAVSLFESNYINVYDLQYAQGRHYLNASRRKKERLSAVQSDEGFQTMIPDAVTLCIILRGEEDRLLTFYEYRYPAGRFLLSPPAGLIDAEDREEKDPIFQAAVRELYEETGLVFSDKDEYRLLNPGVLSSPGMTDESNAIVLFILNYPDFSTMTDHHKEETELFDGFLLLNKEEALRYIREGRDAHGNQYSVYTWQALLYFVSDLWK